MSYYAYMISYDNRLGKVKVKRGSVYQLVFMSAFLCQSQRSSAKFMNEPEPDISIYRQWIDTWMRSV